MSCTDDADITTLFILWSCKEKNTCSFSVYISYSAKKMSLNPNNKHLETFSDFWNRTLAGPELFSSVSAGGRPAGSEKGSG